MNTEQLTVAAVVEIARHERDSGPDTRPLPLKAICGSLNEQPRRFELQLQTLVHAGILKGTRGPYGGYTLALPASKITVDAIVATLRSEEDVATTEALASNPGVHAVRMTFQQADNKASVYLAHVTLDDLLATVPAAQKAAA